VKSLYDEPAYYGMMFDHRGDDVAFYRDLLAQSRARSVIEYGSGAGRVAIPLARAGFTVDAVENASAMLRTMRERLAHEPTAVRERIRLHEVDALTARLEAPADAVISPFNGLAHFERADQLATFFARVHEHLADHDRALFAFDVWIPSPPLLAGAETRSPWLDDPRGRGRVRCTERFAYDTLAQVLIASLEIRDERGALLDVLETRLRQFFPEETRILLAHHGFEIVHRTTRFALASAQSGVASDVDEMDRAEMLAYVCRRARVLGRTSG
jgi:SAM-dependent methyltransferase